MSSDEAFRKGRRWLRGKYYELSPRQRRNAERVGNPIKGAVLKINTNIAKQSPRGKRVVKERVKSSIRKLVGTDIKKRKRR